MTRISDYQPSFNAGELSPRLWARTDFAKYRSGLETVINCIPLSEGGLMRRSASRYAWANKTASEKGRLKKFEFSTTQAYVLEMGAGFIRFGRFQGQISAEDITGSISNGTFTSDLTGWTDKDTGGTAASTHNAAGYMQLLGDGTEYAWRQQTVTSVTSSAKYTMQFRVIGAPGDKVFLRIGTSDGGIQIINDVSFEVGYHTYTFTASATTIYIGFRHNAAKALGVDDVAFIDNAPIELTAPYTESDLYTVEGPQSADVLYFFHSDYPAYKLQRYDHDSWSLVEVAWQDGPYLLLNDTTTTLTPGATTGLGVTVTASSIIGINDDTGFQTTDVGRTIRIDNPASGVEWGWGVITARASTTSITIDVKRDFATANADVRWKLGSWSGTTGYPQVATFFEQRMYAAATTGQPQTFWASQTGDFENMAPDSANASDVWDETVEDDDGLDYTISADDVNAIRWLSAGEDALAIGTSGGEWIPKSVGAVLTPSDITVRRQTKHGSAQIQPLRVGNVVLFVQRAKRNVREFGFSFESDSFTAPSMTRLAEHITRSGIVEMDFAEEPNSLVWAVRADGVLLSMTYRRDEDVVGWARHKLGGAFYGAMTRVWQVVDSTSTFVDETTDANSSTDADWTVFPSSEAIGDYVAIGHDEPFTKIAFDYANGTAGVGGVVAWEYWNGTAWTALPNVVDATAGFTTSAADNLAVTWTMPTDWAPRVQSTGKALYYARARVTTVYTTNPILDQGFIPGTPVVESVVVIPGADGSGQIQDSTARDEVWLQIKRTINGATVRYVEVLERDYEDGDDQDDAYYADSIITYDGAAATTITGLSHIEGEVAKVWADGAISADATVSGGEITLASPASVVHVGLGYKHTIKTLKVPDGNPSGTAVGATKIINGVTFDVLNSHTINFGPSLTSLEEVDFRNVGDAMDTGVALFTGERYIEFDDDWDTDTRILVQSDDPAPFTLRAIAPRITVTTPP